MVRSDKADPTLMLAKVVNAHPQMHNMTSRISRFYSHCKWYQAVPPPQAGPMASRAGRPVGTAMKGPGVEARPMTSNRGANFG